MHLAEILDHRGTSVSRCSRIAALHIRNAIDAPLCSKKALRKRYGNFRHNVKQGARLSTNTQGFLLPIAHAGNLVFRRSYAIFK